MTSEIDTHLEAAALALRLAKQQIIDEIRQYPTPIAGCDVQYNALLSKRMQISKALEALQRDVFVPTPRTLTEGSGVESR